ncbi:aminoglycoside phosphotransferase/kinase family protein [Streptomyces flaveolus]|uniref:hypothetical protein n=1 Tax=Streptomyces flaveolus TaxID=67297 RepID=UPI0036F8A607
MSTATPTHPADPPAEVQQPTERALGPIATWTDTSWDRESSRVWRARAADGGTWYVKIHQNARFHHREVEAYRSWVPHLGASAPTLVAHDSTLRTVVVTAAPGRPVHALANPPEQRRHLFHRIGALAATIHHSAAQLAVLSVLDAVSGISYGAAHGDPELVDRGHRTLARLRAAQHHPAHPTAARGAAR